MESSRRSVLGFLSTPSARRATRRLRARSGGSLHFYPRPPRGGRLADADETPEMKAISIHALREEGDFIEQIRLVKEMHFYPRPPRGGRPPPSFFGHRGGYFYPRPPRGGRHDFYNYWQ